MSKLAIGTAQFGFKYGISNQTGQIKFSEAKKILKLAKKSNIDLIDTAIAYGDSEKVIGDIGFIDFKFVSKLPSVPIDCNDINAWVEVNIKSSLNRLRAPCLYGLLVHKSEDLFGNNGKKLIVALKMLKQKGLVKKIGVSVYDPLECEKVMNTMHIDLLQAPVNIIDQRFVVSGMFSKLHSEKVEIHARSLFLQGLLLMPRNRIPKNFNKWTEILDNWELNLKKNNLSALEVCLLHALSLPEIDRVIVGVDNYTQLYQIIEKSKLQKKDLDWSFMFSNDEMLINPSNW